MTKQIRALLLGIATSALFALPANAQTAPLSADDTDPVKLGWMIGAPPPADKMIKFADGGHYTFPKTRWSFSHFREFLPTKNIWRGEGRVSKLRKRSNDAIGTVTFMPIGGETPMTFEESLAANYTDSIIVLHKGRVVYEKYFGVAEPQKPHISFSVTKSYFGIMVAMLADEGKVDLSARVDTYLPELKASAFGDATVQQLMDMTTSIVYSEDYTDPAADIYDFAYAGGFLPSRPGYTGPTNFYDFLKTLRKEDQHGEKYSYESVNTEVLGWLIKRVTGKPAETMLSERIWQKIGAEQDAYITVDSTGVGFAAGGLNTTLRDHARFGEMLRRDGRYNGQQVVEKSIIDTIKTGGDIEKFSGAGYKTLPGWSYKNQWWVSHNEHGAYAARGVHGQAIYIDPAAKMVIARFASHPMAANANLDPTSLPAFHALGKYLIKRY